MNFITHNKLTVGLTGGILCGKSTALAAWRKAGAFVLSCDEIVRELYTNPTVQKQIQSLAGTLDRVELAKRVFVNKKLREKLNGLLHPLVKKEIAKRLKKATLPLRVIEVPLLFEVGWEQFFDLTVTVVAPAPVLRGRAKQRNLSQADLAKRQKAQLPPEVKAAKADIVVINDSTTEILEHKMVALYRALTRFETVK